ncbi:hypothetical protein [Streptomyces sp. IBSBF 2394]|uniref:hypothetical protein n=1 Tax=Streptomyces sp. IBSBF 2394 TaxID=2903532 RepID=UPI002FDC3609
MPVSLAVCAAAVLVVMVLLVTVVAWIVLHRADRADFPAVLLGLAHVISALCGLLPWGKPTPPPALPQAHLNSQETEPLAAPTVIVVREEGAASLNRREEP